MHAHDGRLSYFDHLSDGRKSLLHENSLRRQSNVSDDFFSFYRHPFFSGIFIIPTRYWYFIFSGWYIPETRSTKNIKNY